MWNQTEFRYGNLINITNVGVCQVTGVLPHRTYYTPVLGGMFSELLYTTHTYIKPIKLTDELLFASGFIRLHGYPEFFLEGFGQIIELADGSYGWIYNDGLDVPLEYVHQLQNLYFCIKKEELDITEIFKILINKQ